MAHCMQVNGMYKMSTAPQMKSISAQIVPFTHKNYNSSLPVLSASSKFACWKHEFSLHYFFTFILRNGKKTKYTCGNK